MRSLLSLTALLLLAGCSGYATRPTAKTDTPAAAAAPARYTRPCAEVPATPQAAFECDRNSILAMAGEFRVRFAFDETAALAPGYAPRAAQRSGATELVEVIADSGGKIVLQHILVMGKDHVVVKHWRQDWQYQPATVLRYRGNGHYANEPVAPADARGAWSQTVYEVDDAPRYAGVGRWTHATGEDSWQSERIWRPLPRREYTKRTDYQVLEVVNRHTLTPAGWVHEQDNTKLELQGDGRGRALAREHGINSYTRIDDYDFGAGRAYWSATAGYWKVVREEWERVRAAHAVFAISPEPNGEPRIEELFGLADKVQAGETVPVADVRALIDRHVTAP